MSTMLESLLKSGFEELGLAADERLLQRYRIYFEYLEEMNKVMNLTAISGEEDVARLHFLDCAQIAKEFPLSGKKLIDVGTGAGFPGLALKIACPEAKVLLLDSLDKRINFLKNCCEKLELDIANVPGGCLKEKARYYRYTVVETMERIRAAADELETITGSDYWPYPSYADILFSVK